MVSYDLGPYREVLAVDVSGLPEGTDIQIFGVARQPNMVTNVSVNDHTGSGNKVWVVLEPIAGGGNRLRLVWAGRGFKTSAEVGASQPSTATKQTEVQAGRRFSRQGAQLFVECFVAAGAAVEH
jgi:hypothetical protein